MKIILDCNIPGASALTGSVSGTSTTYTDKIEAIGIHDHVPGWESISDDRVGEIQLIRYRDRASPKLAATCAAGSKLTPGAAATGSGVNPFVEILLFDDGERTTLFMRMQLHDVYVSRYEYGTVDSTGDAYRRHLGAEGMERYSRAESYASGGANAAGGQAMTTNDVRAYSRARTRPNPQVHTYGGIATDTEVERVWLSASNATWIHADGNVTGSSVATV